MIKIFLIQLAYALVPSIVGLFILAYVAPRIYRLAKKTLQFDLLTGLLVTAFFACLLGLNRALINDAAIAISGESFLDLFLRLFIFRSEGDAAGRLFAVYFLSLIAMPTVILARVIIEGIGEERLARIVRRKRQGISDPTIRPRV
jgi:hypothetical protein